MERSLARVPAGAVDNCLLHNQLSVLIHILASFPPLCYQSSTEKIRSFCKVCRRQVTPKHTRTPTYEASNEVTL